jgi:seryl-tRNA synthetase
MPCSYTVEFLLSKTFKKLGEVREIIEDIKRKLTNPEKFEYSIQASGNTLLIKVRCGERTATSFVLPFYKKLSESLGKNHRIGVKGFVLKDYEIIFNVTKPPKEKFTVPFVDKLEIEGTKARIFYEELDEAFVSNNNVERTLKLVEEKIEKQYYEGKEEYWELIWQSPKREPLFDKDPSEEMVKLGWVVRGPTKGKWFYRPQFVAILRAMEKIVMNEIAEPLGFQEVIGSNVIDGEIWVKTGHLAGVPMEIYYVGEPVSRDPKVWETFIDKLKITKSVPYEEFVKLVELKPLKGLTYAQCPIIYWSFKNKVIAEECLPVKVYDRTQNSFRYESGGRHGIERVDEFHRIEFVFIGKPEQMVKIRDEMVEKFKHIFNNILELEWRMARVLPFYMQQSGQVLKEAEKVKGTIDFEAWLPYRGSREESEWLEFQNISIVGDKYTKAFNIKTQKGELWSGCSGIGLERWCIAFLAQKGLNPENWPEGFKKYLPELPKGFKFY